MLGEYDTETDPDCNPKGCSPKVVKLKPAEIIAHPSYDSVKISNDIALIRLEEKVDIDASNIEPICLPWRANSPGKNLDSESKATVTGWGRTTNNRFVANFQFFRNKVSTTKMLQAKVPLIDFETCSQTFQNILEDSTICAGGEDGKP